MKNLKSLSDAVKKSQENFVVSEVNDFCLRLAVNEGEFPWHRHPNSDELFVVLEGELAIDFQDRETEVLRPHDTLLVKAGEVHRTRAIGRTVNLCFERVDADTEFVE